MKLNAHNLKRPQRDSQRFEFSDEANPGQTWAIWVRKLDPTEEAAASQRANDMTLRYITGGFMDERTNSWSKEPLPFHAIDGEAPQLSPALFTTMARIEMAQRGAPDEERYTAEELIGLAVCMPDAWDNVRAAFHLIQQGADPKAVSKAFMEQQSEPESSSELATQQ
jgi:hypothetical protein